MADPRQDDGICKMSADSTAPDFLALTMSSSGHPNHRHGGAQIVAKSGSGGNGVTKTELILHLGSPFSESDSTEPSSGSRKRKITDDDSDCCDEDSDGRSVRGTDGDNKQGNNKPVNHSEIEKRRRDKMNHLIIEIASLVPMCSALSARKLDKLTVLRWAVQHIKTTRGSVSNFCQGIYKPSFIASDEMKELLQQATYGFLLVVGCDDAKVLHTSDSMTRYLNWDYRNLVGHCIFHFIHPEDLASFKCQMTTIDGKDFMGHKSNLQKPDPMMPSTNLGAALFSPGGKRSFYCRLRLKHSERDKSQQFLNLDKPRKPVKSSSYVPVHCTGFLKSIPPHPNPPSSGSDGLLMSSGTLNSPPLSNSVEHTSPTSEGLSGGLGDSAVSLNSLILLVRPVKEGGSPSVAPSITAESFNLKLNCECRIQNADQRVHNYTGHLPQEVTFRSFYELVPDTDIAVIVAVHQKVLSASTSTTTFHIQHRIIHKRGALIPVTSHWTGLVNPWTNNMDFIIVKIQLIRAEIDSHSIVGQADPASHSNNSQLVIRAYEDAGKDESKSGLVNLSVESSSLSSSVPQISSSSPTTSLGSGRIGSLVSNGQMMVTNANQSLTNQSTDQ